MRTALANLHIATGKPLIILLHNSLKKMELPSPDL